MKKIIWMLILCMVVQMGQSFVYAQPTQEETIGPDVTCRAYCIMDGDTGEVLFSKNGDKAYAPASITKILTALIVAEQCENLDATLLLPEEAFRELEIVSSTLSPASRAMEMLTVRDLLYGMVLSSGNECAAALGYYVAGGKKEFAQLMNKRAKEAGAQYSYFANAHGLDAPNHKATATDMARIFRAALQNPVARDVLSAQSYTIGATNYAPARQLTMGHAMVNGSWPVEGVYAGKTGYTVNAGRTLVTAVQRNNRNLLVVTLGSEAASVYYDTEMLIDYAYATLSGAQWNKMPHVWGLRVIRSDEKGCTVMGWVSENIVRVQVPAWTEQNGQDDLVWKDAVIQNGKASFQLNLSEHKGERGPYTVIFHGYTADGRKFGVAINVLATGNSLAEGVITWNGSQYYINNNGSVAIGLCETEDGVFFADSMGRLQKGMVSSSYLMAGEDGRMIDGWNFWNGHFYYVQKSGEVATGNMQINGKPYAFDASGTLQSGKLSPWVLHKVISDFVK